MTSRLLQSESTPIANAFSFVGGELCLDFINTKTGWRAAVWSDLLVSFENLVAWEEKAGLLSNKDADRLREMGTRRKRKADNLLKEAIFFRETARNAIDALVQENAIPREMLADINAFQKNAGANRQLKYKGESLVLDWNDDPDNFGKLIWPLAESLVATLTNRPPNRIKQCAGHSCEWFFYDSSKNGQRRWCQMSICGNRAKAQRFSSSKKK